MSVYILALAMWCGFIVDDDAAIYANTQCDPEWTIYAERHLELGQEEGWSDERLGYLMLALNEQAEQHCHK